MCGTGSGWEGLLTSHRAPRRGHPWDDDEDEAVTGNKYERKPDGYQETNTKGGWCSHCGQRTSVLVSECERCFQVEMATLAAINASARRDDLEDKK